jgi:hypothetical protein
MTRPPLNPWLPVAAVGDFLLAALHLLIIKLGPYGYVYFGAGSMALLAQEGSVIPTVVTLGIATVFGVWGCYALAGAGLMRHLPLVVPALWAISAVFILRGLIIFPDLLHLVAGDDYPVRQSVFSALSLGLGAAHLIGTRRAAHDRSSMEDPDGSERL